MDLYFIEISTPIWYNLIWNWCGENSSRILHTLQVR